MKEHKFLVIVIVFFVLLNLVYFGLKRFTNYEKWVSNKIKNLIEQKTGAQVSIRKINVNERELNLEEIHVIDDKYDLKISSLFAKYNPLSLLISKTKLKKLTVFAPEIYIKHQPGTNNFSEIEVEELIRDVVKNLNSISKEIRIIDANLIFEYESENLSFKREFSKINLNYDAFINSTITINNSDSLSYKLNGIAHFKKNKLKKADLSFSNFKVPALNFGDFYLDSLSTNIKADYDGKLLQYEVIAKQVDLYRKKFKFQADSLKIIGKNDKINFSSNDLNFNNANISAKGQITKIFSGNPKVIGEAFTYNLPNSVFYDKLVGESKISAQIHGNLFNPKIAFDIETSKIGYRNYIGEDVVGTGSLYNKNLKINFKKINFRGNELSGQGEIKDFSETKLNLISDNFTWKQNQIKLEGKIDATLFSNFKSIKVKGKVEDGTVVYDKLKFSDIKAEVLQNNWQIYLKAKNKDIDVDLKHNFSQFNTDGFVKFKNLNLNNYFDYKQELPTLSGHSSFIKTDKNVKSQVFLRAYNEKYGSFDGIYKANLVFDFIHNKSFIALETSDGIFNFNPYKIKLVAGGSLSKIRSYQFFINDKIKGQFQISRKPKFDFNINLSGNNIGIKKYLSYFLDSSLRKDLDGKTSFNINYLANEKEKISGELLFSDISYKRLKKIDSKINFTGNTRQINIKNLSISKENNYFFHSSGFYRPFENKFRFDSKIDSLNLAKFSHNKDYSGFLDGNINISNIKDEIIETKLSGQNLIVNHQPISEMQLNFKQRNNSFVVNKFIANSKSFEFYSEGEIGYNLYTNKSYKSDKSLKVDFKGDLMHLLASHIPIFSDGKSDTELHMDIFTDDNGIKIYDGKINLNNGRIKVKSQKYPYTNIKLTANFKDNKLYLTDSSFEVLDGEVSFKNKLFFNDKDFIIGNLNLGQLLVKTKRSIPINIPFYTPEKSTLNVSLKGRETEYAQISGPFDDIKIIGDVEVNNSNAIYPENTSNIMSLLTTGISIPGNKKSKVTQSKDFKKRKYPFSLNLNIYLMKDVFYVTYPARFRIKPGSFLNLRYHDGDWSVPDAKFTSQEGTLELFDNTFQVKNVQVILNKYEKQPFVFGNLNKFLADGTEITLELYREKNTIGNLIGDLRFRLTSSNVDDKTLTDIIAKLKYNKNYGDLTQEEKNNLMQDEALQLAGIGINSKFVRPLMLPFENFIRRFFKLDTFNLKIVVISNFIETYAGDFISRFDNEIDKERNVDFSSNLIFNNLSLSAGKYLKRNFYLEYNATFEEEKSIQSTNLDFIQSLNVRFALPYSMNLNYQYKIELGKNNSQEVYLQKSFRF